jgi:hypothetical protein
MKDVLIIYDKEPSEAFVITSLIRRLISDGFRVHCLADAMSANLMSFCDNCSIGLIEDGTTDVYDTAINFSLSDLATGLMRDINASKKYGYGKAANGISFFNEGADRHYRATHIGIPTDANLFQLVFGLAGRTWQGEGYCLQYFPRNRTRHSLTGVAMKDDRIRNYIYSNLKLDKTRLWKIPFKHNILKQIDETNRCKSIITDDFVIFNIALSLRKNVEYIIRKPPAFKLELFGSGNIHLLNNQLLESKLAHVRN